MEAYKTKQGNWQLNFCESGKQKTLYLGRGFTTVSADKIAKIVSDILAHRKRGDALPVGLLSKVAALPERIQRSIDRFGLANVSTDKTFQELFAAQYETKKHLKEKSCMMYRYAYCQLESFFGKKCKLNSVTKTECERFRSELLQKYAACTVSRRIRTYRTIFRFAVDNDWLAKNPFDKIASGVEVNLDNQVYVDHQTIRRVMSCCKRDSDRLILALARFGGLRIPSEIRCLCFKDFDFKSNVIHIHQDTKTGARDVPLFSEIREVFVTLSGSPEELVFPRLGNCHARLLETVGRSGVEVWKKLFVNLRSSCITDLVERGYSEKTLDAIFGNSAIIRNRHYIQFRRDREYTKVLQDDERLLKLSRSGVGVDVPEGILLQKIRQILLEGSPELREDLVSLKVLVNEFDAVKKAV